MNRHSERQAERMLRNRKRSARLRRWAALLSVAVALGTGYLLKMNAVTLERVPTCGIAEHEHTDERFPAVLVCEWKNYEEVPPVVETARVHTGAFLPHVHSAACLDDEGRLACGYVENEYVHTHNEYCYDESGNLVCGLAEGEGAHQHTEECYITTRSLACGLADGEGAHEHTEACYTLEDELTCGLEEREAHVHTDKCYAPSETPLCGLTEHVHTDACYQEAPTKAEDEKPEPTEEANPTEEPTAEPAAEENNTGETAEELLEGSGEEAGLSLAKIRPDFACFAAVSEEGSAISLKNDGVAATWRRSSRGPSGARTGPECTAARLWKCKTPKRSRRVFPRAWPSRTGRASPLRRAFCGLPETAL